MADGLNQILLGSRSFLKFFSFIYPYFLVWFLLVASLMNSKPLKFIIYFVGIIVLGIFIYIIGVMARGGINTLTYKSAIKNKTCNLFLPDFDFIFIDRTAVICWYTFTYLVMPAFSTITGFNPLFFIFLMLSNFANGFYKYMYCYNDTTNKTDNWLFGGMYFLSLVIGLGAGIGWYHAVKNLDKDFLFYQELVSNTAVCKRPSSQRFKCDVINSNGEMISSDYV